MTSQTPSFEDLMNMPLDEVVPGTGAAIKVLKTGYDTLIAHSNLRTYSTSEVFHACPRKYAIKKLQAASGTNQRINTPTFAFGHAVGAGVATFDATRDMGKAIFQAMLAWDMDLLADERKTGRKNGKSFHEAIWALYTYKTFLEEETDLDDYEVVGIEKTVAIDFNDGHYYSGHIDELLRNKYTGRYRVKENKTTGFSSIDAALYSNSDQALGYSIAVDMLGGSEYEVLYTVYSATEQRWVQFSFVKSVLKKAEFIQDQLLINQQIDTYSELGFFPKRGHSCFAYMRRCEYYETCDLSMGSSFGAQYKELPKIASVLDIAAIEHVDYHTTLGEIVARQKEKLNDDPLR